MKKIIISAWSRKAPNGQKCAKNYPFWPELIQLLKQEGFRVISVGVSGEEKLPTDEHLENLSFDKLVSLLKECDTWISVDNFFHHFASFYNKKGIALFSKSDPEIFGDKLNINLLKDKSFLRKTQFNFWNDEKLEEKSFVSPEIVLKSVISLVR